MVTGETSKERPPRYQGHYSAMLGSVWKRVTRAGLYFGDRVFYAFDPRRMAILLIGGDKIGKKRFYDEYIPIADQLYDQHLEALKKEGL